MSGSRCERLGCTRRATHRLGAFMRVAQADPPAEIRIKLRLCLPCAEATTVDDVLGDPAWEQIKRAFYQSGSRPPQRALTTLTVQPLCDWEPITA